MKLGKQWSKKYGIKPVKELTKGTLTYYQWCNKIGRREYIKHSRKKYNRYCKRHPVDLSFRVFKTLVLNKKNVSPELMIKFKKLIYKTGTVKNGFKYRKLQPKQIYLKMREKL